MRVRPSFLLIFTSAAIAGCGDDTSVGGRADAGADTQARDGAETGPDAAEADGTAARDGGPVGVPDAGFSDPDTILEGIELIGGVRTHVRLMGATTSTVPPIVFLHTGPDLAHEYLPEPMRFLLPGRLLAFYDMRGLGRTSFGGTTTTASVTAARHAQDLETIVDWVLGKTSLGRVDLMGHGYGAGIAALYAAAHPERVAHLLLTAPYPTTAQQLARFRAEAGSRLTSSERAIRNALLDEPECRGDINRCTLELWNIEGPHYLCEENRALFRTLRFEYGSYRTKEWVEFDLTTRTYDWRPALARVRAPTTVISGPCDPIPAESASTYTSSISGAVHHVLEGSGHFPMIEARAEYQQVVLEALRR